MYQKETVEELSGFIADLMFLRDQIEKNEEVTLETFIEAFKGIEHIGEFISNYPGGEDALISLLGKKWNILEAS